LSVETGRDPYEQPCSYHPNVLTRLKCSRCGKPICPRCMVSTPVGYRCPDCARGPKPTLYQTGSVQLVRATVLGVLVAAAVGALWGSFPAWGFYCALLLGFGVVESMAWAANYKRGRELQIAAIACIVLGLAVSRLTIAARSDFLTVDMLLNHTSERGVSDAFYLNVVPDVIFMGIPFLIAWIRFR
jgi:hypothetical protein